MRDLSELIAHVQSIVGDVKVATPTFVLSALNLAVATLVRDTRPPDLTVWSPTITILKGAVSGNLPADFLGPKVFRAYNNTTAQAIKRIHYRLVNFFNDPVQNEGETTRICIKGSQFHILEGAVIDQEFKFLYTRKPQMYVEDDVKDATVLSVFPLIEIAEEAIAQHAAMSCFTKIEEGIDGKKVNTETAMSLYKINAAYFDDLFGPQNKEAEPEQVMAPTNVQFAQGGIW